MDPLHTICYGIALVAAALILVFIIIPVLDKLLN